MLRAASPTQHYIRKNPHYTYSPPSTFINKDRGCFFILTHHNFREGKNNTFIIISIEPL